MIIYNPNSGKKANLRPLIEARLNKEKIPFEMMPTKKAFEPYEWARDLDLKPYSALVAAGGDGSYHEVINGLLARKDGFKLPLCFIPNGTGNDLCSSIGIMTLDDSLNYIVSGTVAKFDTIRCLADHESEDTIPEGNERMMYCRHMDVNVCMAMPAKINFGAEPYKSCCGKVSY